MLKNNNKKMGEVGINALTHKLSKYNNERA